MRRLTVLLVPALLWAGAGACDGSGTDDVVAALIEAGILRPQDFPEGWRQTPAGEDDDTAGTEFDRVPGCEGIDAELREGEVRDEDSDDFAMDDAEASNSVTVYEDEATAAASLALARTERFVDCVRRLGPLSLQAAAEEDPEFAAAARDARVEFTTVPVEGTGDEALGFQGTITFAMGGVELQFFMDLVVVRVGRAVLGFEFSRPLAPFDTALRAQIMGPPVERVAAV